MNEWTPRGHFGNRRMGLFRLAEEWTCVIARWRHKITAPGATFFFVSDANVTCLPSWTHNFWIHLSLKRRKLLYLNKRWAEPEVAGSGFEEWKVNYSINRIKWPLKNWPSGSRHNFFDSLNTRNWSDADVGGRPQMALNSLKQLKGHVVAPCWISLEFSGQHPPEKWEEKLRRKWSWRRRGGLRYLGWWGPFSRLPWRRAMLMTRNEFGPLKTDQC